VLQKDRNDPKTQVLSLTCIRIEAAARPAGCNLQFLRFFNPLRAAIMCLHLDFRPRLLWSVVMFLQTPLRA
jgi:ribosomal protein L20